MRGNGNSEYESYSVYDNIGVGELRSGFMRSTYELRSGLMRITYELRPYNYKL
jgi:hypothetical protein